MGNETHPTDDPATEIVGEGKLRGSALNGSEQKAAVDHSEFERQRNPGTELRLDGESDSLYGDGIDIDEEFDTPAGTKGSLGTIP
jgi:hypothetical protein